MGPLRRGLILALAPTTAWAEVCDKERPGWDGLPATPWDEAIAQFSTLPSIALIIATMLVWRYRSVWGGAIVVLCWATLLTLITTLDPAGLRDAAMTEGCRGDPVLFIGAVIAICIATILYTAPKSAPKPNGES